MTKNSRRLWRDAAAAEPLGLTIFTDPNRQPRYSNFKVSTFLILLPFLLASCTGLKPLKGGHARTSHGLKGIQQSLAQGDNPSQPTRQDQETIKVRTYTLPAGSRVEGPVAPATSLPFSNSPALSVVLSAPMPVVEREESRAKTELGAAQKDGARELGARLASLRGVTWAGLALFVFGLASLVWPPLKAMIGSVTTSAAIVLGGLALLILPTLIVGNELLILGESSSPPAPGSWHIVTGNCAACSPPKPAVPMPIPRPIRPRRAPVPGRTPTGSSPKPRAKHQKLLRAATMHRPPANQTRLNGSRRRYAGPGSDRELQNHAMKSRDPSELSQP